MFSRRSEPSPVQYEIDQKRLETAIDQLTEDVPDWCEKPTVNQSRLLMMYYDKTQR